MCRQSVSLAYGKGPRLNPVESQLRRPSTALRSRAASYAPAVADETLDEYGSRGSAAREYAEWFQRRKDRRPQLFDIIGEPEPLRDVFTVVAFVAGAAAQGIIGNTADLAIHNTLDRIHGLLRPRPKGVGQAEKFSWFMNEYAIAAVVARLEDQQLSIPDIGDLRVTWDDNNKVRWPIKATVTSVKDSSFTAAVELDPHRLEIKGVKVQVRQAGSV
jgi:hypothetical protein